MQSRLTHRLQRLKKNEQKGKKKTEYARIYFPLIAVLQFHPLMDQYCTFLPLTALSGGRCPELKNVAAALFFFLPHS